VAHPLVLQVLDGAEQVLAPTEGVVERRRALLLQLPLERRRAGDREKEAGVTRELEVADLLDDARVPEPLEGAALRSDAVVVLRREADFERVLGISGRRRTRITRALAP
jgi:hypothetical protein